MQIKLNHAVYAFTVFFLCGILSCNKNIHTFGKTKIEKSIDSIYLKQRIAEIKSLNTDVFAKGSFKGAGDTPIVYRLLKPKSTNRKLPLVIVFHGSNAVGNDNTSQLGILAKLFATDEIQAKYPAFVLAPQFPSRSSNYILDQKRNVLTSAPQPCLTTALQLVDSLKNTLNIDEDRIYLIGFSMGASSVINALSLKPNLFAAGISISGIPQFDKVKTLTSIPIWLIHGNMDTENPFNSDEKFFEEVRYNNRTRFWEFDNLAHNDIFAPAILTDELPKWLFKNKRK
ncbi:MULTISPECIES: alpha/beta hydrolase-fold protein [unclassified Pedobacter]|uniref:carboxylesterase family protein n=1 Tax=unclassified Pedobacter TaxID=2628915 RepID=UPI0014200DC3|nr:MULTISPECIES: alpha/beta hydrolase-fold protein [unclassified Pedobacter]NII85352.1 putative peptidase [Pedobacter sp. SG908]NMN39733.1 putative peptidase [Pedobacter sp. SG918]